jgi:DNA transformation protein
MSVSATLLAFLQEQLRGLGAVSARRMFSGAGLYADGVMYALIARETLYLKVDIETRPDFEADGMEPFSYETSKGRNVIDSYWRAPERLFDDADEMVAWARKAVAAAKRAASKKPRKAAGRARGARKRAR